MAQGDRVRYYVRVCVFENKKTEETFRVQEKSL